MLESIRKGANKLFDKAEEVAETIQEKAKTVKEDLKDVVSEMGISEGTITIKEGQGFVRIFSVKNERPAGHIFDMPDMVVIDCLYLFPDKQFPFEISTGALRKVHEEIAEGVKGRSYYQECIEKGYSLVGLTGYNRVFIIE